MFNKDKIDYKVIGINVFSIIFLLLAVVSWIPAFHPKESQSEKRELTKFPEFTTESFFSGAYFSGISDWFADTFPMRDVYISINTGINTILKPSSTQIHGDVIQGDEIPTGPMVTESTEESSEASTSDTSSSDSATESTSETTPEVTDPDMTGVPVEQLGALLIVGDTGYEYYNFVQSTADKYITAINRAGQVVGNAANVYVMVIPTSMDITLPSSVRDSITNVSNQKDAINYMYSSIGNNVKKVELYDALKSHRNEYIYFRNDHHWTSLGAWYSYLQFAELRGRGACSLENDFTSREFTGFRGTFYNDSGKDQRLNNPDTVVAYTPNVTNDIKITQKDGTPLNGWRIIYDVSDWRSDSKYNTFIGGDNPWSVITNPTKTDGSACLIIKDSFGNAFTPFLVPDYQYVYVLDYRYYKLISGNHLLDVVAQYNINDVIFCNNISSTRNKDLVNAIANFVG
ncbi:DHHW protein [Ruminococcaceae bacterium YRB3002]|nr:DHHW protein [Ruminococcaceae bacterium YRB3002]